MKRSLKLVALGAILMVSGCTVFYRNPATQETFLGRFGYDTKVGVLTATEGVPACGTQPAVAPTLHIENMDSTATALQTANKALDLATKVAP